VPRLIIPPKFRKILSTKPTAMQAAVITCVHRLGENPAHPGLRVHKMQGQGNVWEAYVDRANRVTFDWSDGAIRLRNNCNHDMLSRRP